VDEKQRYEQGLRVRREVLGDAHVERAERARTPFNSDFQDLITRYAWGEIWSRPGLETTTRRLMTLSMLIALNREEELRMHLRAALEAGVTREQIREAILHSALYCGVPAANAAFRAAEQCFPEESPGGSRAAPGP